MAHFDDAQVNNILGKTRKGDIQHPKEEDLEKKLKKEKELEKKKEESCHIVDGVQSVVNTTSVKDYFAMKMAAKGLNLANILNGVPTTTTTTTAAAVINTDIQEPLSTHVPEQDSIPKETTIADVVAETSSEANSNTPTIVEVKEKKRKSSKSDSLQELEEIAAKKAKKAKKEKKEKKAKKEKKKSKKE